MNYYIIKNDYSKIGVPPLLNAVLTESFDIKNPMPPMSGYSWTKRENKVYPNELCLVTKDKKYNFDYIGYWDGYVISKEFKMILEKHIDCKYFEIPLDVINWKGKTITGKEYYFIDIPKEESIDCIDYDNSEFSLDNEMINLRGSTVEKVNESKDFYGNIKEYNILKINHSIHKVLQVKDITIHDLMCSEIFKDELLQSNLYGITYINTLDATNYYSFFRN